MSAITYHCGPYAFTVYGGGTAAELRKGDYSDIATYEGTGPEPEED